VARTTGSLCFKMEDFDTIYYFDKNYSYDSKSVELIVSNRRSLEGQLFIDRLLALLDVKAVQKAYPPKNNHDLRHLHKQVVSSSVPDHQKQAVIYYLLKDCRGTNDAATQFARRCYLPENYRLFIEGLWHLDHLELRRAVEYLTEPSLIPTFPDEILHVLTLSKLPKNDDRLAMGYYLTVSPPLAPSKVQQSFFDLLCRASVTEAFFFTRRYDDRQRKQFLEQLVVVVLKASPGPARGNIAMELINLPFDGKEEQWFENCLLNGQAKTLPGAKDTVLMRRLATRKTQDLIAGVESLSGKKVDGINWDDLRHTVDRHVPSIFAYDKIGESL